MPFTLSRSSSLENLPFFARSSTMRAASAGYEDFFEFTQAARRLISTLPFA